MYVTIKCICHAFVVMGIVQGTIGYLLSPSSDGDLSHGETSVVSGGQQARRVFQLSDFNNDSSLTYNEFKKVFSAFDANGDRNVTATEFLKLWSDEHLGVQKEGLQLFLNLDVSKDFVIEQGHDMPFIFGFFDRNDDHSVSEDEFVVQWLKISS